MRYKIKGGNLIIDSPRRLDLIKDMYGWEVTQLARHFHLSRWMVIEEIPAVKARKHIQYHYVLTTIYKKRSSKHEGEMVVEYGKSSVVKTSFKEFRKYVHELNEMLSVMLGGSCCYVDMSKTKTDKELLGIHFDVREEEFA